MIYSLQNQIKSVLFQVVVYPICLPPPGLYGSVHTLEVIVMCGLTSKEQPSVHSRLGKQGGGVHLGGLYRLVRVGEAGETVLVPARNLHINWNYSYEYDIIQFYSVRVSDLPVSRLVSSSLGSRRQETFRST
jgi:hypothetical protein